MPPVPYAPPLVPLTIALYAGSCAFYLAQFAGGVPAQLLPRLARWLLMAAFVSHMVDIGFSCVHGDHPFRNAREAISFFAWLSVASYLGLTWRRPLPLAGALIVPVALVLDIAAHIGVGPAAPTHTGSVLATVHIGLAMLGITAFAVASGDAAVYLYAEMQLKARRGPPPPLRQPGGLPSLEALDRFNRRAIQLGFPLFTLAMITGAVWQGQLPALTPDEGALRFLRPQYAMATLAWLLYALLILARFIAGWRGRRAALLTLGGFAASLCVLAIYYVRDLLARGGA